MGVLVIQTVALGPAPLLLVDEPESGCTAVRSALLRARWRAGNGPM